jgi:hypothetical protein
MKLKLLLILSVGIFTGLSVQAYDVSTEIQKKNILLEVFTGIHCGNCPDGDVVTDNFLTAQPECTYSIDIHSGHYAVPNNANEPDYRIDEGEWIDVELGANNYGYPGGAINRRAYPDYEWSPYVISRSSWIQKGKTVHEEDAPVNLYLKSVFEGNTRELTVTVEGYYTDNVEQSENFLHVVLIQDNIKGLQGGSSQGNNYNHRHMLRAFLTPVWGDKIETPRKGEYFSRDYTYILPENIKGIALLPEDVEVIAFVTVDRKEVLNVTGKKPEYLHYSKPLAATLQYPKPGISGRYGYNFFNAIVKNEYSEPITTAGFEITINGEKQTVEWTGNLPEFQAVPIRIDVSPYPIPDQNEYTIRLVSLNGTAVAGNSLTGSFSAPVKSTSTIQVDIKTDSHADENIYVIKDRDGNDVHEFGPYSAGIAETYTEIVELEPEKYYCFEAIDLWGNGIQDPRGFYKFYSDNRTLLAQNYEIKVWGDKVFFQTVLPASGTALSSIDRQSQTKIAVNAIQKTVELSFQAEAAGQAEISVYSIDGKRLLNRNIPVSSGICRAILPVSSLSNGIYLLSINQKGKREILKFKI